ncbi:MAG: hypothetical protein AUJ96_28740 [Armatimonadetes bacterium CG2_30_66_41]|nr:MAG: hypothetical protein AUJ96_28740 [Armatimonadetes bacterium CG2_30_66_41]
MSTSPTLTAGVARATITPPVGIDMSGFAGREPSLGIHDELYATALVFEEGEERVALVTCDLLFLEAEFVGQVREEAQRRTSLPAERVGISCSHTHYGPTLGLERTDPDVRAYLELLKFQLAGAIQEAAANVVPVTMGVGWGACDIGINRRERKPDGTIVLGNNPEGTVDRAVGVVRIDRAEGGPLAVIANFACHCVSQSGRMRLLSADYPGPARALVEGATSATGSTGATFLFAQGAGANTNPIRMEHSYEPARTLGTRFGCEVLRVWETVAPVETAGIRSARQSLELPALTFASVEEGQAAVADLTTQLENARKNNAGKGSIHWLERRLERSTKALENLTGGEPLPTVASEVQVLRAGEATFCLTPGEVFCEIGMEVRERSPLPNTLFLAYSNGSIGYVPTPESYPEGGYEVSHACRVGPGAAGIIVEASLAALRQCA